MPDSALFSVSASWGSCVSAKKINISIQRSRNTFKLLFKSKIKVKFNHWDHDFQFPECLIPHFFPFLQVQAVSCLVKNNNSIQLSRNTFKLLFKSKIKVEFYHWDHESQFPECLIPHFFPFLQVEAVAFLEKNNNSIQRARNTFKLLFKSKIKVEINHWDQNSSFRNA